MDIYSIGDNKLTSEPGTEGNFSVILINSRFFYASRTFTSLISSEVVSPVPYSEVIHR